MSPNLLRHCLEAERDIRRNAARQRRFDHDNHRGVWPFDRFDQWADAVTRVHTLAELSILNDSHPGERTA